MTSHLLPLNSVFYLSGSRIKNVVVLSEVFLVLVVIDFAITFILNTCSIHFQFNLCMLASECTTHSPNINILVWGWSC